MNISLSHLPEYKQAQLKEITGITVKAVDPEKVILFGSHATGRWANNKGKKYVFYLSTGYADSIGEFAAYYVDYGINYRRHNYLY